MKSAPQIKINAQAVTLQMQLSDLEMLTLKFMFSPSYRFSYALWSEEVLDQRKKIREHRAEMFQARN